MCIIDSLVIDRFVDGASVSSEKLPCDGMAEFYFEDMDAFECFYDSKEFQRLAAHGSEFIGSVDTYLVEDVYKRQGAVRFHDGHAA